MTQTIIDALETRFGAKNVRILPLEDPIGLEGHYGYRLSFWLPAGIPGVEAGEHHMLFKRALATDMPPDDWMNVVEWGADPARIAEYILAIP